MNQRRQEHEGEEHRVAAPVWPATATPPWQYTRTHAIVDLLRRHPDATAAKLSAAAGLDWGVYQTPAYFFAVADGEVQPLCDPSGVVAMQPSLGYFKLIGSQRQDGAPIVPTYYLNVRDDLQQVVGIVRRRYRVLQNGEAPLFLDQLVRSGDATWHTAGSLHGGSQVFWLLKLTERAAIGAGDPREELETLLLLLNSHDGSTSLAVAALSYCPASSSTFAWPLPSVPRAAKVRHTDSARNRAIEARRALELGQRYQSTIVDIAERMVHTPVSDRQFLSFLDRLIPTPTPALRGNRVSNQRGITMADNTKGVIVQVYFNNEVLADIRGTLWGAVQACAFYSDHLTINRNTDGASAEENRFKRLISETTLGSRAFASAMRLLPS